MLRPFRSIHPIIHPSAYVDISAQVIGDVHLGAESSIWMNVVVRGDVHHVRIGARTNLQDLTLAPGRSSRPERSSRKGWWCGQDRW